MKSKVFDGNGNKLPVIAVGSWASGRAPPPRLAERMRSPPPPPPPFRGAGGDQPSQDCASPPRSPLDAGPDQSAAPRNRGSRMTRLICRI